MLHVVSSREQDWTEQEVCVESTPTIIYQEVSSGESQSATSTIKALLELQQTTGESKRCCKRKLAAAVMQAGRVLVGNINCKMYVKKRELDSSALEHHVEYKCCLFRQ